MRLAIISHTEHYYTETGTIVGLGSTVREVNELLEIFEEIYHVAPLHKSLAPKSALPYKSNKIKFVPLEPAGGKSIKDKIKVLFNAPKTLFIINKTLKLVDIFQYRAPTSFGVYVLPYVSFQKKPKWVKYAGNWVQEKPVLSSAFQRWWLKNNFQRSLVTINGSWIGQRDHLITFENPCITEDELEMARKAAKGKDFGGKLNICFVGRIEREKGVDKLLEAISILDVKENIGNLFLVGKAKDKELIDLISSRKDIIFEKVIFTGELSRRELDEIYNKSHVFCLPSLSEGFPKALIEAAAYGCVPVVSNVSSIGQYVNQSNGTLLINNTPQSISKALNDFISNRPLLAEKSQNIQKIVKKFTYSSYNKRILKHVVGSPNESIQ